MPAPSRSERVVAGAFGAQRDEVGAVGDAGLGTEDRAELEQGEIGEAAREVAMRDLDETGQQGAAQQRHLGVERVLRGARTGAPGSNRSATASETNG